MCIAITAQVWEGKSFNGSEYYANVTIWVSFARTYDAYECMDIVTYGSADKHEYQPR